MPVEPCPTCGRELEAGSAECPGCAATFVDRETLQADPSAAPTRAADESQPFTGPSQIAHYRVIRELGAGGIGTVFEAHDERMDRRVALKVLSRHQAPSDRADLRFAREAWIAGKLEHPALVKVYDRGTWEELSYYSMELITGGSLFDVVSNLKRWGRDDRHKLEFGTAEYVSWAVGMVIGTARGLEHAHQQGVVHRDIKPMNLLLSSESGSVKIADFGLAVDMDASRMTTAGTVLGTLAYMAPEQMLGKQDEVRPATDVYALGVTLFELLTLDLPFSGKTQQLYMNAVLTTEARRPRKLNERVSKDLETVVRKAMEKEPRDRYASAGEFADDLESVLHFRPITARPPGGLERLGKWVRRRPVHAALLGVLLVATPTVAFLGQRALERRELLRAEQVKSLEDDMRFLWQRGKLHEVVEVASRILEAQPDHLRALQQRAIGFEMLAGDASGEAEAEDLGRRAVQDSSRIVELLPDVSWAHHLHAFVLREVGREQEASAEDAVAAQLRPEQPTDNDLYFDGVLASRREDYETAVQSFSDALVLRPSRRELLFERATAYERLGRLAEAIQDHRLALALNPDDAGTMLNLGALLARTGSLEEGGKYTRRALQLRPNDALVHQALAHESLELGRAALGDGERQLAAELFSEAEGYARKSLELHPGGGTPGDRSSAAASHLNLGASLIEQSRLSGSPDSARIEEAARHYDEATRLLVLTPGREAARILAITQVNTCDVLIEARSLDRALEACLAVTGAMPNEPVAFYNLAGVYALLGRTDEAFDALARDVELGDNDWQYLEADAWFAALRSDSRFQESIDRMKRGAGS